ncbi:MAG: mannonate dehydratase [Actinomycetota bacterium]|nr:mannonate dehydratase [Actinomycetota bacterium]
MRVALGHVETFDDDVATFARQLGLRGVQLHTPTNLSTDAGHWRLDELVDLRRRVESHGLVLEGLENVPRAHFDRIQQGLPGRDEQLESFCRTVENMGAAGIPVLGYNFIVTYVWRTDVAASGRGGARVTAFDLARVSEGNALSGYKLSPSEELVAPVTADELWANYRYFLDAVLPVAERAGVRLALHPDDPPVEEPIGGAARIFTSPESLVRALDLAGGSPAWGLDLCLGTVSEMGGEGAVDAVIDTLAASGRVCYVHFRDVVGTVPSFRECFLGEGNLRPERVVRRLADAGFDGFVIDDHVPAMLFDADTWVGVDTTAYCSRGRAHAVGYLQGVIDACR